MDTKPQRLAAFAMAMFGLALVLTGFIPDNDLWWLGETLGPILLVAACVHWRGPRKR